MAQLVDWDLAAATAGALGRTGPAVSYTEATEVVTELRRLTDEAASSAPRTRWRASIPPTHRSHR